MGIDIILGIVKIGLVALCGLALFIHVKNSGRTEQVLKDKKASEDVQKKIDAVDATPPPDVVDELHRGDF